MKRVLITLAAMLGVAAAAACGDSRAEYNAAVDTLTRRQKDSLVSTMPIPGAGGVRRAQGAADAARARAAQLDSIGG